MPTDFLVPSRIGAPGSLNAHTRNPGKCSPAFKHFIITDTDKLHYYTGVFETKAPLGTSTGGHPRQYASVNAEVRRLDNGAESQDTTFGDVTQGMTVFNPGGFQGEATAVTSTTLTDSRQNWPTNFFATRTVTMGGQSTTVSSNTATVLTVTAWTTTPTAGPYIIEPSGTPNLLITFGTSATLRSANRNLTTDTAPWTTNTATSYAQLWQITRIGGAGYAAATDAGTAALGEWRVSICPLGNDPRLVSSWGNGFEIGGPEWPVANIAALGNAPVVGKPDGLYYYDLQTRRYENVLRNYEVIPHALNGKVTESVTNGVIYTTNSGEVYLFDGVSVTEISPNKFWPILSKDIGNSRITAVADSGQYIAMVTEAGYQTTQNVGLQVVKVDGGTATDITSGCVGGNFAVGGDVSSLGNTTTDYLYVGANVPIVGFNMHVTRKENTNTETWDSLEYGTGVTDTFTAFAGYIDGTQLAAAKSLALVAYPPAASAGALIAKDVNAASLVAQTTTVQFGGGVGTVTGKYWLRASVGTTGFDATTEIDELEAIVARAGMPNGGIYSATNNFTPMDREGLLTHVYLMKREKTTGFVPHDSYAVLAYPGVWKMCWHTGRLGQASGGQNLGQSLILWGRWRTVAISESPTRDPIRSKFPLLQNVGTVGPGMLLQIAHDWRGKPDEWHRYKMLERLHIDTRFVQPTDNIEVFAQFDEEAPISLGMAEGGPLFVVPGNGAPFRYLNLWLGFKQAATTPENAPYFVEPFILTYTVGEFAEAKDKTSPVPSVT